MCIFSYIRPTECTHLLTRIDYCRDQRRETVKSPGHQMVSREEKWFANMHEAVFFWEQEWNREKRDEIKKCRRWKDLEIKRPSGTCETGPGIERHDGRCLGHGGIDGVRGYTEFQRKVWMPDIHRYDFIPDEGRGESDWHWFEEKSEKMKYLGEWFQRTDRHGAPKTKTAWILCEETQWERRRMRYRERPQS